MRSSFCLLAAFVLAACASAEDPSDPSSSDAPAPTVDPRGSDPAHGGPTAKPTPSSGAGNGATGTGTGTGTATGTGTGAGSPNPPNGDGDAGGGTPTGGGSAASFKSPVYFMPLDNAPQDLAQVVAATGNKSYLLAFVLDSGGCTPAWDGLADHAVASDTQVAATIAAARGAGADVGVSFGGYNGTELGQSCASADALAAAYQSVIDKYGLTHIDLDVENAALGDEANEAKRFRAVKILQDAAAAKGRALFVSLTIPTTTVGLPDTGKAEIKAAIAAGARLDVINAMDFDYGGPAATQVQADIGVADAVKDQLVALYGWSDDVAYAHLGLQLMNGHTDQPSELFTQDTFNQLLAYAKGHHVGWFAFWSLNRDRACDPSVVHNWADGACSSVDQQALDFTKILAGYGG
jgi:hypothetical protein